MDAVRITKEFTFEMAHALEGYDGACSQIHGHSYRLWVTLLGRPIGDPHDPKFGMVMDFGELKSLIGRVIVSQYDHALIVRGTPENKSQTEILTRQFRGVRVVDFQPTCENMVIRFAGLIRAELPPNVTLCSLRLHETATSFAEWFASDNE